MKRNKFSLSHYNLLTLQPGRLYPVTWFEALPGDSVQMATSMLIRTVPLVAPVMHPVQVRVHHWFVPNRLIWEEWEDFITGGNQGTSTPTHPYMALASLASQTSIHNYLGIPLGTFTGNLNFSALPLRAYQLIWNEHYRDQDLQTEAALVVTSGLDQSTAEDIQRICWEKDYFTTCRPWETKGTDVQLPIGVSAPVLPDGANAKPKFATGSNTDIALVAQASAGNVAHNVTQGSDEQMEWDDPNLYADLQNATGVNVNDLRLALAMQRYQESRSMYGSRYVEYLRVLGIRPSDGRLQNPEYLGGGKQTLQFSEVLQTSEESTDPLGSLAGHGIGAVRSNRYRRFFEEHGIVMTCMSIIPKSIYTQSVDRSFLRTSKEDYYQKEFAFLGDQEVPYREIMADHSTPEDTFGYQQRYDEYRQKHSRVAGQMVDTLDYWHLARQFASDVALNSTFVACTPTDRVWATTATHPFQVLAQHSIQARRMLPANPKPRTF